MTLANLKLIYKHFVETNQSEKAREIAEKYPLVIDKPILKEKKKYGNK